MLIWYVITSLITYIVVNYITPPLSFREMIVWSCLWPITWIAMIGGFISGVIKAWKKS
jgi:hypothetical protein